MASSRSSLIGGGCVLAVILGAAVAIGIHYWSGHQKEQGVIEPVVPVITGPVTPSCPDPDFPNDQVALQMFDANHVTINGLYICTNSTESESLVVNDTNAVWLDPSGTYSYWSPDQDASASLTTQVFRAAIRRAVPQPYLTIEPGEHALLSNTPPSSVELRANPTEQVVWQVSAYVTNVVNTEVQQVEDVAKDNLKTLLKDDSHTRTALVECAIAGYNTGKALSETPSENEIVNDVQSVVKQDSTCIQQMKVAQAADEDSHILPVLAADHDLAAELKVARDEGLLDAAARYVEEAVEHLHAFR
jgi:hypothetical protein